MSSVTYTILTVLLCVCVFFVVYRCVVSSSLVSGELVPYLDSIDMHFSCVVFVVL